MLKSLSFKSVLLGFALSLGLILSGPVFSQQEAAGDGSRVLARVGDAVITARDFDTAFLTLPEAMQAKGKEAVYAEVLELLIQQVVIVSAGRADGLADAPAIQSQIRELENRLIYDAYLQKTVAAFLSEDLIRQKYEEYLQSLKGQEEIKARHILLENRQDAENIIILMGQQQDFATLARKYSTGPSAPDGGDLGYFTRGQMVKPFEDVAFSMQPNTYTSTPVETKFGWHVILVEDRRPALGKPYAEVRNRLRQVVGEEIASRLIRQKIDAAGVERFDLNGRPLMKSQ
ncbi:MAG: peptidylprolyl isomerase [Alphaproteobacteria bacterium]|nr:peptidylprolyl isomerase [Alphaproteobacteria bacterium]